MSVAHKGGERQGQVVRKGPLSLKSLLWPKSELAWAGLLDKHLHSLLSLVPPAPPNPATSQVLFGLAECGVSLGHEHPGLGDGSLHLNSSRYPATCVTDIMLNHKHPEVSFSMEQAGV